ncbi:MAG: sugar transferase [Thermoleophilia bacterium]
MVTASQAKALAEQQYLRREMALRRFTRPRLLLFWDLGVGAAVLGALLAVHGIGLNRPGSLALSCLTLLVMAPATIHVMGGYETSTRPLGSGPLDLGRLMLVAGTMLWILNLVFQWRAVDADLGALAVSWPLLGCGWFAGRLIGRRRLARHPQSALVIGTGPTAERVVEITRRHPEHGVRVLGLVDDDPSESIEGMPPVLGGLQDLQELMDRYDARRIIVAFGSAPHGRVLEQLRRITHQPGVRVQIVPRLWELVDHDAHVDALGGLALLESTPVRPTHVRNAVKRILDVTGAGFGLVAAAPVMALVAILIRLDSSGPAVFRQVRIGRDGREFKILKFRTMYIDADSRGLAAKLVAADTEGYSVDDIAAAVAEMKQADDPRITKIGRFLRKTSLDELPQLWNVVRGDMSIVGPRPLRPFEVATLEDWQHRRHDVRPGITGTWQVLGRSDITWEERMQMDYSYARNQTLRQDLRVLARTAQVVVGGKGSR